MLLGIQKVRMSKERCILQGQFKNVRNTFTRSKMSAICVELERYPYTSAMTN